MGLFLSLSSVVNKTSEQVIESLSKFAPTHGDALAHSTDTVAVSGNGSTTIMYPCFYDNWDNASKFLSRELQATVFSFHIHDGDLWMFILYNCGEQVTQFNPLPDYWSDISASEREHWLGSVKDVSNLFAGVEPALIEKYFLPWTEENEGQKAYTTDTYAYGDCWQLRDFMTKLGLPFPIDEAGNAKGEVCNFGPAKSANAEPKLTVADLKKLKGYSKGLIPITKQDFEFLTTASADTLSTGVYKGIWCEQCQDFEAEMVSFSYGLSVDQFGILFTGVCKQCNSQLTMVYGVNQIGNLKSFLER